MFTKPTKKTVLFNYKKKVSFYKKFILIFFIFILFINLVVYHNLFFVLRMDNGSMIPNINKNDLVLFKNIELEKEISDRDLKTFLPRGTIIAFNPPNSTPHPWWIKVLDIPTYFFTLGWVKLNHHKLMIGRLVAYPGEKIEIKNKVIYLDGKVFLPNWILKYEDVEIFPAKVFTRDNIKTHYIDNYKLFIINDNWDENNDSRQFGEIDINQIKGRSVYIYPYNGS